MTVVKRVGVLSYGKVLGIIYALLGLIAGGVISLFSLAGAFATARSEGAARMLFGVGAIIFIPICYGLIGFIGGIIIAALYNLIASWIGGVEIELELDQGQSVQSQ